ncbi:signal peptidase I [Nocardioides sp. MAH-18]|uniref:Signal peptidase I n=1 Tax=Nocardioides agri TaxID=2682843 RepID=A0A6L6XUS8_9ACTN|nr:MULTISPECIES: signal peptidase I [unclassified Nocardioides]MBA2956103.1 signal peptidase I [Nocardioides sp. CGMCC 1.13656]MVQ50949.1 signal peptidase I [Nocardioides sp. MAH-18]
MEITTAPRPPAPAPWGRLLLCAALFAPVTFLVLLPMGLGFERYVMTGHSMAGSVDRGSVAFERVVPVSDLQVGDIITYPRPDGGAEQGMVTHRIVYVGPDGIVTRGDAEPAVDPWVLRPAAPTVSRVEFVVPWVGWAYLFLFHPPGVVLVIASGIALVFLTRWRVRPRITPAEPGSADESQALSASTSTDAQR